MGSARVLDSNANAVGHTYSLCSLHSHLPSLKPRRPFLEFGAFFVDKGGSTMSVDRSRIIVCDDEKDNADSLAQLLRVYGYEVLTCFDGGGCLRTAQTWLPYAAIVDIGLPDMTGYELARALRSLPNGSDLLLIAVSGYGNADYVETARLAGFNWHFQKPARPSAIVDVLRDPALETHEGKRLAML